MANMEKELMEKEIGEIYTMEECNLRGIIADVAKGDTERIRVLENITALYGGGFIDDYMFVRIVKAITDEHRDVSKIAVSSNLIHKAVMVLEALA